MMGKILAGFTVLSALIYGAVVYYYQEYGYYEEIAANGTSDVQMTTMAGGLPEPVLYDAFKAIDANSSPIRYRACFTTTMSAAMMSETYTPYEEAVPRVAPKWFDCFDAMEIGQALERGEALAFLGTSNIQYGIDRVVAVMPDGRGFVWHQINECGDKVFNGEPAPEDCPSPPHGN